MNSALSQPCEDHRSNEKQHCPDRAAFAHESAPNHHARQPVILALTARQCEMPFRELARRDVARTQCEANDSTTYRVATNQKSCDARSCIKCDRHHPAVTVSTAPPRKGYPRCSAIAGRCNGIVVAVDDASRPTME